MKTPANAHFPRSNMPKDMVGAFLRYANAPSQYEYMREYSRRNEVMKKRSKRMKNYYQANKEEMKIKRLTRKN